MRIINYIRDFYGCPPSIKVVLIYLLSFQYVLHLSCSSDVYNIDKWTRDPQPRTVNPQPQDFTFDFICKRERLELLGAMLIWDEAEDQGVSSLDVS